MLRTSLLRGMAALAGAVLLLVAAWGVLFVLLVGASSAQAPDPFAPTGDPCCGHPDTWGQVASGVGWTLVYALLDSLIVCLAVALFVWARALRWPRVRHLALLPGGVLAAASVTLLVVLLPLLDEGRTAPACDTFAFSTPEWSSVDLDAHYRAALGVAHCDVIKGSARSQVRSLLGRPRKAGRLEPRSSYWSYDGLTVYYRDDRVRRVQAGAL